MAGIDLSVIWAVIIIFSIMMYVVMDGFDLGIGILFPLVKGREHRSIMMNTVAPIWDGNETWLVLGGAGLFGAFPLAYSVVLSALYLPLIFMLIGLIFRGVAFEFRFKVHEGKEGLWDKSFIVGSVLATFCQGVALGTFIDGIPVLDQQFAGGSLDWLNPFPLFCGVGLIAAYALLGSTWLIMKTEGELQARMRAITPALVVAIIAMILIVSLWTPFAHPAIADRWFTLPNIFWFAPVPILVLIASYLLFSSVKKTGNDSKPFLLTLLLIFLGYTGLGISIWPNIIPPSVTIWEAASPPSSQLFLLIGTLFIIPMTLMYTAWGYYVFRGKVNSAEGYH
jgi:cytochrome d ubiquinol oxidase subunit II